MYNHVSLGTISFEHHIFTIDQILTIVVCFCWKRHSFQVIQSKFTLSTNRSQYTEGTKKCIGLGSPTLKNMIIKLKITVENGNV